jgi:hypothetical protein
MGKLEFGVQTHTEQEWAQKSKNFIPDIIFNSEEGAKKRIEQFRIQYPKTHWIVWPINIQKQSGKERIYVIAISQQKGLLTSVSFPIKG